LGRDTVKSLSQLKKKYIIFKKMKILKENKSLFRHPMGDTHHNKYFRLQVKKMSNYNTPSRSSTRDAVPVSSPRCSPATDPRRKTTRSPAAPLARSQGIRRTDAPCLRPPSLPPSAPRLCQPYAARRMGKAKLRFTEYKKINKQGEKGVLRATPP